MQKIQLYIEGQRVDLFEDESVVLTQSIQNVKDVQKGVYRLFKDVHNTSDKRVIMQYLNTIITTRITNGFDGRRRVSANLRIKLT